MPRAIMIELDHVTKSFPIHSHRKLRQIANQVSDWVQHHVHKQPRGTALRRHPVITDVSFAVRRGEVIGLYGPNGSGKSTLLQLIAGIVQPSEGRVAVNGQVAAVLGLGSGLHPDLTGRDNIALMGTVFGMDQHWIDRHMAKIIETAGIKEYIDMPVKTYSSGMRIRLAFASIIFVDADIFLLDEIFAVGDRDFYDRSLQLLQDLRQKKTIVLTSHSLDLLHRFCDVTYRIRDGKVLMAQPVLAHFFLHLPPGEEFITTVVSNSMAPTFFKGDSVRVKKVPYTRLKVGDIVALYLHNVDEFVVHRIIHRSRVGRQWRYQLQGDNNASIDNWTLTAKNYVGRVEKSRK